MRVHTIKFCSGSICTPLKFFLFWCSLLQWISKSYFEWQKKLQCLQVNFLTNLFLENFFSLCGAISSVPFFRTFANILFLPQFLFLGFFTSFTYIIQNMKFPYPVSKMLREKYISIKLPNLTGATLARSTFGYI